MRHKKHAVRR